MNWSPVEVELESIVEAGEEGVIDQLAEGQIPAAIFRQAIKPSDCEAIMNRLIKRELLFDPNEAIPVKFREESIPEGHYREGNSDQALKAWKTNLLVILVILWNIWF